MELERKLTKKRCLFGYSVKDTSMVIQSLQEEHLKEMEELKKAIVVEKEKNKRLKEKLGNLNMPQAGTKVDEEVMIELKNYFFQQTKSTKEYEEELENRFQHQKQQLDMKIQQKELVQKRIQEVLEYLTAQKNELQKELNK